MSSANNYLQIALQKNNLVYTDALHKKLIQYVELLQQWNRVFNLTAIDTFEDMITRHVVDSLVIAAFIQGNYCIDVGSGAGLPGIPLALTLPETHWVLLDSNGKKTRFLTQVVHALKIPNVEIIQQRVEDYHPEKCFDSILSRAFSALKPMLLQTAHLAGPQSHFLAMKGVYPNEEIAEIPSQFKVIAVHNLAIVGLAAERHLIDIQKG